MPRWSGPPIVVRTGPSGPRLPSFEVVGTAIPDCSLHPARARPGSGCANVPDVRPQKRRNHGSAGATLSHIDYETDVNALIQVARSGCYLEFDLFARTLPPISEHERLRPLFAPV